MDSQVPTITIRIVNLSPGTASFDLAACLACSEGIPHTYVTIAEVAILCPLANCPIDISLDIPVTKILEERIKLK